VTVARDRDRLEPVRAQIGGPLPDGLAELTDDELADLALALEDAHREQARALDGAIDHTLRYLPWPLSRIVKKVLVG
jgi:hypothetical protein